MSRGTLLAGHGLRRGSLHLRCILHEGAERAEHVHQAVAAEPAIDALGLADQAPDFGVEVDADGAQRGQAAVEEAALADLLGRLAGRHARDEVRDDAEAAVVEAPAQTVGPLTHGDAWRWRSDGRNENLV